MCKRGFLHFLCVGLAIFCADLFAEPLSPADLDAIAQRAGSVERFLNSPEIQQEYFEALKLYYGKYPREAFDAILAQLRITHEKLPGLSERLWETSELGVPFEMRSAVKTSGRTLGYSEWTDYRSKWEEKLALAAEASFSVDDEKSLDAVKVYLEGIRQQIQRLDDRLADKLKAAQNSKARKAILAERASEVQQMKLAPKLREANSYLLHRWLGREDVMDAFSSGDADLILDKLAMTSQDPKQTVRDLELNLPEVFAASMRDQLPTPDELTDRKAYLQMLSTLEKQNRERYPIDGAGLSEHTIRANRNSRNSARKNAYHAFNEGRLFPIDFTVSADGRITEAGAGEVVTIFATPLPRRFHGIWDGAVLGECVAGNPSSLDSLTPERWAVVALHGTQKHHLSKNGRYLGFTQQIPGRLNGKIVASAEFGAPQLRNRAIVIDPNSGDKIPTTIFNLWLDESAKHLPEGWTTRVIGESNDINNAGVLDIVRQSPSYILNRPLGKSEDFQILDPIALKIPTVIEAQGYARNYGGRMITDATVKKQTVLRPVEPITEHAIADIAKSGERDDLVVSMLRGSKWPQHPKSAGWIEAILERGQADKGIIRDLLNSYAWESHPNAERWFNTIFERGTADEEIARALKSLLWGERPMAATVLRTLVERGTSDAMLVEEVLGKPHWSSHPEAGVWLGKIIERGKLDRSIFSKFLWAEPWKHHESHTDWLMSVAKRGKEDDSLIDFVANNPEESHRLAEVVDEISKHLNHNDARKFAEKILTNADWASNKRSYLWHVRTELPDVPMPHLDLILANRMQFPGESRELLVRMSQEQPHFRTRRNLWAVDELIQHAESDPDALIAVGTLIANHRTFHHEKAFNYILEVAKRNDSQGALAIKILNAHVGVFAPGYRSSKETLVEDALDLAGRDRTNQLDSSWKTRFEVHDLATEDALFHTVDRAIDRLVEEALKRRDMAGEIGISISNLGSAYAQNTLMDEGKVPAHGLGIFWILGETIADKKKIPLARKALSKSVDLAIHYPALAPFVFRALRTSIEKGFTDEGRTEAEAHRFARNFPEQFDHPDDIDKQVEHALVRQRAAQGNEDAIMDLVARFGLAHVAETDQPETRQIVTRTLVNQSREQGINPLTDSGELGQIMNAYRARHPEECAEALRQLGDPKWLE